MTKKIAIIGAGIAGLTIGKNLQAEGFEVNIFDKGRGVGGRMSSRRTNWGYLDHGCQYFTAKDSLFASFIQENDELVQVWQGKFARWQDGNYTPLEIATMNLSIPFNSPVNPLNPIPPSNSILPQSSFSKSIPPQSSFSKPIPPIPHNVAMLRLYKGGRKI